MRVSFLYLRYSQILDAHMIWIGAITVVLSELESERVLLLPNF